MRTALSILLFSLLCFSANAQQNVTIDFTDTTITEVNVIEREYSEHYAGRKNGKRRKHQVTDGQLQLYFDYEQPIFVRISATDNTKYYNAAIELLISPGEDIKVTAHQKTNPQYGSQSYLISEVEGSPFNTVLTEYNNLINRDGDSEDMVLEITSNFIETHRTSPVSAFILLDIENAHLSKQLCDKLDKSCFVGLCSGIDTLLAHRASLPTMQTLSIGDPAIDFSAEDYYGNTFTLSTLKGKWVVLYMGYSYTTEGLGIGYAEAERDNAEMMRYYDKYKEQIEFVFIEDFIPKNQWRESVKSRNYSWTSIYTEDREPNLLYWTENSICKVIIDPEGVIHSWFFHTGEDFYQALDQLMKKG